MKKLRLERPPLLVDLIIEKLEEAIINGVLLPSTRLTEEALSKQLNTSRTPLRESLIKLEQMGFVKRRDGGGWDVMPLDFDKILERYEVKVMIEVYALLRSTAATRRRFLEKARDVLDRMKAAMDRMDYQTYRELDMEFHQDLLLLYENEHVEKIYLDTIKHVRWLRRLAISPFLDIMDSFRDHGKIVAAVQKGDISTAAGALIGHLERLIGKVKQDLKGQKSALARNQE